LTYRSYPLPRTNSRREPGGLLGNSRGKSDVKERK
jgi:hypothetical protein